MKEVELLGVHSDGNQLILNDGDGKRYALPITDQLREAVRTAGKPVLKPVPEPEETVAKTNPAEIQSMIRAGMTVSQVAKYFGTSEARIRGYAEPIWQERQYMANLAQECQIGAESDSPRLGDLTIDRLAARGVDPTSLSWDATRRKRDPWIITLTFIQNAREITAQWQLEKGNSSVTALDQEAIWLTETSQSPASYNLSNLSDFRSGGTDESGESPLSDEDEQIASPDTGMEALLDALNSARGQRQQIDTSEFFDDAEDEDDSFIRSTVRRENEQPAEVISFNGRTEHGPAGTAGADSVGPRYDQSGSAASADVPAGTADSDGSRANGRPATPDPASRSAPTGPAAEPAPQEEMLPGLDAVSPAQQNANVAPPGSGGRDTAPAESTDSDSFSSPTKPIKAGTLEDENLDKERGRKTEKNGGRSRQLPRTHRRGRAEIPSWDDILLGTKSH